jgi:Zn-dependent M28 family amino/carboxypeptidase
LDELELAIDAQTVPQSRILAGISVAGETQIVSSKTAVHNVVGLLPGRGALATEYVIIGAHYDHVGMGGVGSLAPGTIEVHNGADDNASGTSTLLEVARRLVEDSSEARRSIIFIAFTAEERGLLGSKYYVRHPRWPLEQTVAMLNMDMVGRLTDNNLTVYGTGTATQFNSLIDRANELCQLEIDKQAAGFGPSDHSSFYEVDIPVFHFFTGLHNDYHRPSDDFDKANVPGMARIAEFVTAVLKEVATLPERPTLIKSSVVAQIGRALQPRRVTLGVRLESSSGNVLKVEGVLPDSPAQRAGIQAGDRIVALGEQKIESLAELQRMLANFQAGTTVMVEILRGGEQLRLSVTF